MSLIQHITYDKQTNTLSRIKCLVGFVIGDDGDTVGNLSYCVVCGGSRNNSRSSTLVGIGDGSSRVLRVLTG